MARKYQMPWTHPLWEWSRDMICRPTFYVKIEGETLKISWWSKDETAFQLSLWLGKKEHEWIFFHQKKSQNALWFFYKLKIIKTMIFIFFGIKRLKRPVRVSLFFQSWKLKNKHKFDFLQNKKYSKNMHSPNGQENMK